MTSTTSYNNDKVVTGEVEYPANDPASGAFFQTDYKKNEDLKLMLDGSKDSLKLEAMKRIIGMVAKGRDASDLFPAVVKNVVSKNIEVKKLVYVYLVRYAEEQQDLALLSISTFQRALKDPNQLIRASALRVLSSIRVPMIVPIVMLAIRDSASDMSPYVRKTAAHAIPKLYSLDPEQKEELVGLIDKLLSDKAPLVVGSAAMAFSEVCAGHISLISKSYRKLCSLLADVDEWGQLALLNVLTVYARSCFPDPNLEFSSESESEKEANNDENESDVSSPTRPSRSPSLDPDLRLLLRAAKPLLQSRNSGVVMAVAQLFFHCGPVQELPPVAKAMVRLLRAPLEVQSVVLNSIASSTVTKPALFEPFLKSFFVRNSDPTHIKLLKLEILTNLATEASAPVVLREFQTYVTSSDKAFAGATIQAIGRLAVAIHSETETCLNGLLHLLSSKDEWVVCEAVVVVKRVVGGGAASARAAVARAAKLLRADRLGGGARAAALWLVAEHGAHHPRAAAILAHMAKNFADQEELVKLQVLSLAAKLHLSQPETAPVGRYVVALARYDVSYDVRDRARLLRFFLDPPQGSKGLLRRHAHAIFRPDKPKPQVHSTFTDRQQYTVGTLSQYIGIAASGYRPLPVAPPTVIAAKQRDTEADKDVETRQHNIVVDSYVKNKSFYSEPESSGTSSASSSSSDSTSSEESSDEEETKNNTKKQVQPEETNNLGSDSSGTTDSESDSDSSSSESRSESDSDERRPPNSTPNNKVTNERESKRAEEKNSDKSNLELLLELDAVASTLPTLTPTAGGFLSPDTAIQPPIDDSITAVGPQVTQSAPSGLVPRVTWGGLEASFRWLRNPHLYSHRMCAIEILFTNHSENEVTGIRINKKTLSGARSVHDFAPVSNVPPGGTATTTLGVDFADSIQPIHFTIVSSKGEVSASIVPPVGELMRAVTMPVGRWDAEHRKLRGMTECDKKAVKLEDEQTICKRVYETANVGPIITAGSLLRFAGRMMSSQDLVLLSVKMEEGNTRVVANCPNMAIASLLANEVAQAFAKS